MKLSTYINSRVDGLSLRKKSELLGAIQSKLSYIYVGE